MLLLNTISFVKIVVTRCIKIHELVKKIKHQRIIVGGKTRNILF